VFGTLFMAFGFAALFLAAIGLYGVMSFSVSQRRREMGIRMALGAKDKRLIRLAMQRGLRQLAIGVVLGIGLAALATRPLQIILYEVDARDPVIFGGVVLVLALVGLMATYLPARRVSRIHPAEALTAS
jgi:ABC-type antimicrobial peptide transport system permease subunit